MGLNNTRANDYNTNYYFERINNYHYLPKIKEAKKRRKTLTNKTLYSLDYKSQTLHTTLAATL